MMTDGAPLRLTDDDVAAFYGKPFDQLTITQQALSDDYWDRRWAAGTVSCTHPGHDQPGTICRQVTIRPAVQAILSEAHNSLLI